MPSMKCGNCLTVKKCKMYMTRGATADDAAEEAPSGSHVEYLCLRCARDLGYRE